MKNKRILCAAAAAAILITALPCSAETGKKEEVIYANLKSTGAPQEVYAVNIFNVGAEGIIADFGDYKELRNMNTSDKIEYDEDMVTISTDAPRLYYEGKMSDAELPWNVSIAYLLNGNKINPDKLAGSEGLLEINITVTENENADPVFFENYALQISLELDTKICKNITAEGANIINAGSAKQINYTILPGSSSELKIMADVTDFSMKPISLNGLVLSLGIDFNNLDGEAIRAKISGMQSALSGLSSGAGALFSGAGALSESASSLTSGIDLLYDALNALNVSSPELTGASGEFKKSVSDLKASLDSFAKSTENLPALSTRAAEIAKTISSVNEANQTVSRAASEYGSAVSGLGISHDSQLNANDELINSLNEELGSINNSLNAQGLSEADRESLSRKKAQTEKLLSALTNSSAIIRNSKKLADSINASAPAAAEKSAALKSEFDSFAAELSQALPSLSDAASGLSSLSGAVEKLISEYAAIDGSIKSYTDAVSEVLVGYSGVYSGTFNLIAGTKSLYLNSQALANGASAGNTRDPEITAQIDSLIDKIINNGFEITSFTSPKNTEISSVQFIMKTPAVRTDSESEKAAEPVKLSPWQRFLRLFRLGKS